MPFFDVQHTPERLGLIFCTLILLFRNRGQVSFSSFHFCFAHTLALQVFKFGFWDENLVLHLKLNAQRGLNDAWFFLGVPCPSSS
jgi:hypothetical protein